MRSITPLLARKSPELVSNPPSKSSQLFPLFYSFCRVMICFASCEKMSFWSWICIFTVTFGLNMLPKPWHKWGSPACQHLDQRSCPQTRFHSCGAPPKNSKESRFELVWTWIEFHLYTQYNSIPVSVKIQSTNSNSTSLDSSSKRSWKIMFAQA